MWMERNINYLFITFVSLLLLFWFRQIFFVTRWKIFWAWILEVICVIDGLVGWLVSWLDQVKRGEVDKSFWKFFVILIDWCNFYEVFDFYVILRINLDLGSTFQSQYPKVAFNHTTSFKPTKLIPLFFYSSFSYQVIAIMSSNHVVVVGFDLSLEIFAKSLFAWKQEAHLALKKK